MVKASRFPDKAGTELAVRPAVLFFATGAYMGYVPVAPGTVGSLWGIPWALLFHWFRLFSLPACIIGYIIAVAGACWVAGKAEEFLQEKDSQKIVIDEMVGFVTATLFLGPSVGGIAAAFLLFRLFDIWKPFPVSYLERHIGGGMGVVLDDVVAGLYANGVLRVLECAGLGLFWS